MNGYMLMGSTGFAFSISPPNVVGVGVAVTLLFWVFIRAGISKVAMPYF
jgi:hypothetical protein